ncbi:EmrB/QacA subfamily drug resistance transporter [Paenibacillus cellulosilyticus]|uniref:EmrB/QacA subfamily drug resistance transporter n=1 Tax=Paenibacillus cellulosilyticus TaxID=375489 RepID=A0A2V2YUG5_9BACL|nr:DHA2 family efflux MFS transporter permease subunit [Paenibacillus cellulosilyticus]PWW02907.1 EmrB/QacA subfamily drug resistance transporter [Paenibacillus cellulosilyticus]QKS45816.1 DHA2 family efflux MFS transporter permease subunit [Paenibacillus cellulosilyticus]
MSTSVANAGKKEKEKLDPKVLKVALVLVFGALAPQLDSTMVNVAIDSLTADLSSTVSAIQWVITGYILAMGLAVPISGWAINRFGGKKVYMLSLIIFLISSILCSVAWNTGSLIGFRVLQGIGGGLLIPTLQTMLVQTTNGRNLGRVISIIGIPTLLGPILGPVLGGIMVNDLSWRWIFYVNIPVTLIALWLAWTIIPSSATSQHKQSLDIIGLLLLSPAFAALIYGIAEMSKYGSLNNTSVSIPLLIGAALMVAYIIYALRTTKVPVLDLRLFRSRHFLASNITLFLSGMTMNGALLLLPLYYQQVRGESVIYTGLLLIPQGIGMLLTRSWIGKLADRIGSQIIVIISLAVTSIGTLPYAFAGAETNHVLLAAAQVVRGAALNGILIPIMVAAYEGLRKEQIPHASVSTRIFQTIGGAFGAAILATAIDHYMTHHTITGVTTLALAYQEAFWWSIGFSVIAVIPSLLMVNRKKQQEVG